MPDSHSWLDSKPARTIAFSADAVALLGLIGPSRLTSALTYLQAVARDWQTIALFLILMVSTAILCLHYFRLWRKRQAERRAVIQRLQRDMEALENKVENLDNHVGRHWMGLKEVQVKLSPLLEERNEKPITFEDMVR